MTKKETATELVKRMKATRPDLDEERALKNLMKYMTTYEVEKALEYHKAHSPEA